MSTHNTSADDPTDDQTTATTLSVSDDERQQILLDDLRVEIARLAAAVERQNELLAADNKAEVGGR